MNYARLCILAWALVFISSFLWAEDPSIVTTMIDANTITIDINDGSNGVNGYYVFRSDDGGITYNALPLSPITGPGEVIFNDTGFIRGCTYVYSVYANDSNIQEEYGNSNLVYSIPITIPLPSTPGLTLQPGSDGLSVDIMVTDTGNEATSFLVQRSCNDNDADYQTLSTIYPGSPTYRDSGLADGTQYYYRVLSLVSDGSASLWCVESIQLPRLGPISISVDLPPYFGALVISCVDYSTVPDISIVRGDGQTWNTYAYSGASDSGPFLANSTVEYTAYGYGTNSSVSTSYTVPGPYNLSATATLGYVTLTWQGNCFGTFLVEKSIDGGMTWTEIGAVDMSSQSFVEGPLFTPSVLAQYRLTSYPYWSNSPFVYSNTASVNTLCYFDPINVVADYSGGTSATLSFSCNTTMQYTITCFEIERSTGSIGFWADGTTNWNWVPVAQPQYGPFLDTGLTEGTQVVYHVRADSGSPPYLSPSDWVFSNTFNVQPAAPSGLVADPNEGLIQLTWNNVSEHYDSIVLSRVNLSSNESVNISLNSGSTTFYDTSAVFGQTYSYVVSAISHGVLSDTSNAATGSPLLAPFVSKTGDTMTGGLQITATNTGLTVTNNTALQGHVTIGGNLGIGVATPTAKLEVNGDIKCKDLKVTLDGWPDYVFEPGYKLADLKTVEAQIKKERHLSGIPSAERIAKEGMSVPVLASKQLEKIEELTLYMIQMQKQQDALQHKQDELAKMCAELAKENKALKDRLESLSKH